MAITVLTDGTTAIDAHTLSWTIPTLVTGDVAVVAAITWDQGITLPNPSGTGLAFGAPNVNANGGSRTRVYLWAMTATAGGSSVVVTCGPPVGGNSIHSGVLVRFPAADGYSLAGSPNILSDAAIALNAAIQGSLTGTSGNLAVIAAGGWDGTTGHTSTDWAPAGTTDDLYVASSGDSTQMFAHATLTGASTTVGPTVPTTGSRGTIGAIEILKSAGGATAVDGWTPMRPGFMVGAAFPPFMWAFSAPFSSDSTAAPVAASGTGDLTLSASGVAAATAGGTGSLTFGASSSAAAPAAGTGSLTLGGSGTAQVTAAGTGSLTLSATGAATAPATGTGSITFSATGTAAAQGAASGTGSITLSATGSATSPAAGTGSITFSATGTATGGGVVSGTGSITLAATGSSTSPAAGTAALSLSATGNTRAPDAGTGSLSLSAAGVAAGSPGGTGTLTLVAAGTGRAVTVSTASLTLAAAGAIAATAGGTAQLVLSATGTGSGPITADPNPINITIREDRHTATLVSSASLTVTADKTRTSTTSDATVTIRES